MNSSLLPFLSFSFAAAAIADAATPQAGAPPAKASASVPAAVTYIVRPADASSAAALPPPLRFDKIPLTNAARVLSARYHVPIMIEANTAAPISGDFSFFGASQAVAEAARQANLVATPLGAQAWSGYRIGPSPAKAAGSAKALARAEDKSNAIARKRTELLDERAKLLAESARLDP